MQLDFTSEELMQYRAMEMVAAIPFIRDLLNNNTNPDYIRGAMGMIKKILAMPNALAKTPEQKEIAQQLTTKTMELFEKKLLRAVVEDE